MLTTYVAFLRAINVGGHTVTMDKLRALCGVKSLGLANVTTFIASGNVVFDTGPTDIARLEHALEAHLEKSLGYKVATFIRSVSEVAAVAAHRPFTQSALEGSETSLHVVFLRQVPTREAARRLMALRGAVDDFHVRGREVYWLLRGRFSDSKCSGALLEKTLGMSATVRNVTTIRRLAGKLPSPR